MVTISTGRGREETKKEKKCSNVSHGLRLLCLINATTCSNSPIPFGRQRTLFFHLHLLYFSTVVTYSVNFYYTIGWSKQDFLKDVCMFSASLFPHDKVIDAIGLKQNIFACCPIDS